MIFVHYKPFSPSIAAPVRPRGLTLYTRTHPHTYAYTCTIINILCTHTLNGRCVFRWPFYTTRTPSSYCEHVHTSETEKRRACNAMQCAIKFENTKHPFFLVNPDRGVSWRLMLWKSQPFFRVQNIFCTVYYDQILIRVSTNSVALCRYCYVGLKLSSTTYSVRYYQKFYFFFILSNLRPSYHDGYNYSAMKGKENDLPNWFFIDIKHLPTCCNSD